MEQSARGARGVRRRGLRPGDSKAAQGQAVSGLAVEEGLAAPVFAVGVVGGHASWV
jgi:hypothetical protein